MAIPSDVVEQVGSEDGVPDPFAGLALDKSMLLLHNNKPVGTLSQVRVNCLQQADPDDQHQHTHPTQPDRMFDEVCELESSWRADLFQAEHHSH